MIDREKIDELVDKFNVAAHDEWNYTVFTAASLFLADLIFKADMKDKDQFVDALCNTIKAYLRNAGKNGKDSR